MDELINAIRNKNIILFVGAGLSRNLNLPTWEELIEKLSLDLNYEPEVFKTYGDFQSLAEYYQIENDNLEKLAMWMDSTWHDNKDISLSELHKLVFDLDFPIIYTTNYDRFLEKTYDYYKKEYVKISSVIDMVKIKKDLTQIIKFHGDFDNYKSMVLTEKSYFERLNFESFLDIKLRSDFLGKSILFLGYSLSDINIRFLLFKLDKLWKQTEFNDRRPKSYIFLTKPNPVFEKILGNRGITVITATNFNPQVALLKFLTELAEKIKEQAND